MLSNQLQFLDQTRAFTPFVDHIQDIADIHCDTTLQIRFEGDIATHSLPVTVESKTDQTGILIEYRAPRVSAGNIVVR